MESNTYKSRFQLLPTLSALAVLAGLAACGKENFNSSSPSRSDRDAVKVILIAGQEDGTGTRAAIGKTAGSKTAVLWSANDKLSVFDGADKNIEFTLTDGSDKTSGTFEGDVSKASGSYVALHPYQSTASINSGRNTISGVTLKSSQTAVAGSFDPEAALMVATESTDGTLAFKNAVGFVKLTPEFDCRRITLTGQTDSDALAGIVDISLASDGTPKAGIASGASSSVSIAGEIKKGSTYYIAALPATLKSGFELVFTDSDGNDHYGGSAKTLEIKRNTITDLGSGIPYLSFSASCEREFKMNLTSGIGDFQYSVGGAEWETLESGESIVFGGDKGDLRLRGISPLGTATGSGDYKYSTISFDSKSPVSSYPVSCTGDIRTLVDWQNYHAADTGKAKFCHLFSGNSFLSSVPDLPATTLAEQCYYNMFYSCTGLTSLPEDLLPATSLSPGCYKKMFYSCTGLTSLPEKLLPATSLSEFCYDSMFSSCTGLASLPEKLLPATSLEKCCYEYMFYYCKNLTSLPEGLLSAAKELKYLCYAYMFKDCIGLGTLPENLLPATTLANDCYQCMFDGCAGLVSVPEGLLSAATELKSGCYGYMFRNCTALTTAPELPATTLPARCYSYMFEKCTSLTSIKLRAVSKASDSLKDWLSGTVPSPSDGKTRTIHTNLSLTEGTDYPGGWEVAELSD